VLHHFVVSLGEPRRQLIPPVYQPGRLKGCAETPPKFVLALTLLMTRLGTADHAQSAFATDDFAVAAYFFN